MKRLITILLAAIIIILAGGTNYAFASETSDAKALAQLKQDMRCAPSDAPADKANKYFESTGKEKPSNWAIPTVAYAIAHDYVPERLQGNYTKPITREEFCELYITTILGEYNDIHSDNGLTVDYFLDNIETTTKFSDTNSKYVGMAQIMGIVEGVGKGKFNPNGLITREQVAVMLMNKLQSDKLTSTGMGDLIGDMTKVANWAKEAVARVYPDIMNGIKTHSYDHTVKAIFDPKASLTREQAITIMSRQRSVNGTSIIRIRNYVYFNPIYLDAGIEIDGDVVKLRNVTDRELEFTDLMEVYVQHAKDEEGWGYPMMRIATTLFANNSPNWENQHLKNAALGKRYIADYTIYKIERNPLDKNYAAIFTKTSQNHKGYITMEGGFFFYWDKDGNKQVIREKVTYMD